MEAFSSPPNVSGPGTRESLGTTETQRGIVISPYSDLFQREMSWRAYNLAISSAWITGFAITIQPIFLLLSIYFGLLPYLGSLAEQRQLQLREFRQAIRAKAEELLTDMESSAHDD